MQELRKGEKITLRAVWGKQQGPLRLCPAKDALTGQLLGVKFLKESEKADSPRVVTAETERILTDDMTLSGDNPVDLIDWDWIQETREVSPDFATAQSEPGALFYVDQPDKEIDDRITKREVAADAMDIVRKTNSVEREELCRMLGQNVEHWRDKDIKDYLYGIVEENPKKVIDASDDPNRKTKMFLYKLLDKKIITKDADGIYKYGSIIMGLNETSAIVWINDSKNKELVSKFYRELNPAKPASTVIEDLENADNEGEGNNGQNGNIEPEKSSKGKGKGKK
jgi:hypothetical protein